MNSYFECAIRYEKVMENGAEKKVTERYLVNALSFTEAEARIVEEMKVYISGEFAVKGITPSKYSEVVPSDDSAHDKYWAVKIEFFSLDEKSGTEKINSQIFLVQADTVDTANRRIHEHLKQTMCDYRIVTVKETKIVDVYEYNSVNS